MDNTGTLAGIVFLLVAVMDFMVKIQNVTVGVFQRKSETSVLDEMSDLNEVYLCHLEVN